MAQAFMNSLQLDSLTTSPITTMAGLPKPSCLTAIDQGTPVERAFILKLTYSALAKNWSPDWRLPLADWSLITDDQ